MSAPVVVPVEFYGKYKTASIVGLSRDQITQRLGFPPNLQDDPEKVAHAWGFEVDGQRCAIWDWKGSHRLHAHSAFGPREALARVFAGHLQ